MHRPRAIAGLIALLAISWVVAPYASREAQDKRDTADTARLVEVLQIRAGSVVADVGAGSGPLSVLLSPIVGPSGSVIATDVNQDRLKEIRAAVDKAGLKNVTVIEAGADRTNLRDECCDAIFMRLVYHHFTDPTRMNRSLLQGLKPGGRMAVVEFRPKSGQSALPGRRSDGDDHGIMPATVIEELKAAGFANVREEPWTDQGFLIVAEKK